MDKNIALEEFLKNRNELYFCLDLTENEHWCMKGQLEDFCNKNDLKMVYYRKLSECHVPCHRECKISGENIGRLRKYLEVEKIDEFIVENPHRTKSDNPSRDRHPRRGKKIRSLPNL